MQVVSSREHLRARGPDQRLLLVEKSVALFLPEPAPDPADLIPCISKFVISMIS